jgi:hypothetical protein
VKAIIPSANELVAKDAPARKNVVATSMMEKVGVTGVRRRTS